MQSKLLSSTIPIGGGGYLVVGPAFNIRASVVGSITVMVQICSNALGKQDHIKKSSRTYGQEIA